MSHTGKKRFDLTIDSSGEWLEAVYKKPVSEFGAAVATILSRGLRCGIYDVPGKAKADFASEQMVEIVIDGNRLSTYDFSGLTRLVILCHDAAIRMEINPRTFQYLLLRFHPRDRDGTNFSARHPGIFDAIKDLREGGAR